MKQTSGDLYQMEQIRRAHPDLVLYNGYDEILLLACWPAPMAGSVAPITLWAGAIRDRESARAGDIAEAQRLQCECNKAIDLLIKTGVFRG